MVGSSTPSPENESGVTLMIPITNVRLPHSSSTKGILVRIDKIAGMRFSELLADLALHGVRSRRLTPEDLDPEITEVSQDSRTVTAGALFVAVPGIRVDAHYLVADAADAGATALLLQREVPLPAGCAAAVVDNTRFALGLAAASIFGHPTEEMTVIGVTGTDGKTTTCLLTVEALRACGVAAGGM